MKTRVFERFDLSAGIQQATSWLNRAMNELDDARNARFNKDIGAAVRRNGYVKSSETKFSTVNNPPTGFHTAQFTTGAKKLVAVNSDDNLSTLVRVQNSDGTYTTLINDLPPNVEVHFCDFRDEVFVSGFTTADGVPFQPRNIDKTLDVSLTRNLLYGTWPKYFVVYRGVLYAANVRISTDTYPDRFYKSSAPTGAITFVRGAQTDILAPPTYVNLFPVMTSFTAPSGTVSSNTGAFAGEEAYRALDQNSATFWTGGTFTTGTGVGTGILTYDFGSGVTKVAAYYSMNGFRPSGVNTRVPRDWTLEASNNGTAWTVLDTKINQNWTVSETRMYSIANTTAYRYYRVNITKNQSGVNADAAHIAEFGIFNSLQDTKYLQLALDSVRYIKAGMSLEIYKAGKIQRLYTISVVDVDKANNTIQFVPENQTLGTVTAANDTIVVPSTANMPTGTPIIFSSTGTLPAPIIAGTTYYVIQIDATTIKISNSLNASLVGTSIDITNTGSGTHNAALSYVLGNNDEIWLNGRFGKLTSFWNTDYPTLDKADWSAVQPGSDSSNAITGVKEGSNRLFVFTLNSASRFDGTNTIPFSKTIGCASQRSIQNIDDDWLIWLTARGRVYARNETAGQQEYISRGLANKFFNKLNLTQLKASSAGITDNEYAVYVGLVDGKHSRAVYDFGSNTWTIDELNHPTLMYANDSSSGFTKPYFLSNNGYMYQDDTGELDDDKAIRFLLDFGQRNYGTEAEKYITGNYVYSENAKGTKIGVSVDGGEVQTIGEIKENYGRIEYEVGNNSERFRGSVIRVILMSAVQGPAQKIFAVHDYFNIAEEITGHGKKQ